MVMSYLGLVSMVSQGVLVGITARRLSPRQVQHPMHATCTQWHARLISLARLGRGFASLNFDFPGKLGKLGAIKHRTCSTQYA